MKVTRCRNTFAAAFLFACSASCATELATHLASSASVLSNDVEASLVRTFQDLGQQGLKSAISELDHTLIKNPNFRLGQIIKGDLLMATAGRPVAFAANRTQTEALADLREEGKVRFERYFDAPPADYLPTALLQLAPQQKHVLLVDGEKSRLYVFQNVDGKPQYVTDYYISSGKNGTDKERQGDQKTPLGVYHVTSTMPKKKLAAIYGDGAFTLSYPNEWDKRTGKNGSGIWIHGTPSDTYSRPPRASDGCVVLTNDDLAQIGKYIDIGSTPVVIAPKIDWQAPGSWELSHDEFAAAFNQWHEDWESLNVDKYLAHYAKKFNADGKNINDWSSYKRGVNAQKTWVKVSVNNLSIFNYPHHQPMMMVTFDQEYKSNNNATRMKKRQYWAQENGQWKIIYEAAAS